MLLYNLTIKFLYHSVTRPNINQSMIKTTIVLLRIFYQISPDDVEMTIPNRSVTFNNICYDSVNLPTLRYDITASIKHLGQHMLLRSELRLYWLMSSFHVKRFNPHCLYVSRSLSPSPTYQSISNSLSLSSPYWTLLLFYVFLLYTLLHLK